MQVIIPAEWSTAISVIVKDITPPAIVKTSKQRIWRLHLKWQRNRNRYCQLYGIPQPLPSWFMDWLQQTERYLPNLANLWSWKILWSKKKKKDGTKSPNDKEQPSSAATGAAPKIQTTLPLAETLYFSGEITKDSVDRGCIKGNYFFSTTDHSAGIAALLCLLDKSKDSSDNLSGSFPHSITSWTITDKMWTTAWQNSAWKPAIISGLYAQAEQIRIEWMGPPSQDTRAYHVYRAEGTNHLLEPGNRPSIHGWGNDCWTSPAYAGSACQSLYATGYCYLW